MSAAPKGGTLVEHEAAPLPVPVSDAAAFLVALERAARDPSVDVGKMERLMQMRQGELARLAEVAFNTALAALQTELPEIPERGTIKNKSGGVQSTYALWEDLNEIVKPILSKHRFSLNFRTGNVNGKIAVTGILRHAEGHSDSCTMEVPLDTSGAKNEVQGLGSSTAYGKRYVASALLNLTSRGLDDDGQGGNVGRLTDEQKTKFREAITLVDDMPKWQALWQQIVAVTPHADDRDEMRSEMAAKRKELIA